MDLKTFHKQFRALSKVEQDILKVLAIAYEKVGTDTFSKVLKDCGIQRENGLPITLGHLGHYKEMLRNGKWLGRSRSDEIVISEEVAELAMRMAVIDEKYKTYVRSIKRHQPYRRLYSVPVSFKTCIRELRLALYDGSVQRVSEVVSDLLNFFPFEWTRTDFFETFFEPFDPLWLNTFPVAIQEMALSQMLNKRISNLEPIGKFEDFLLQNGWLENTKKTEAGTLLWHLIKIRKGQFAEAKKVADQEAFSHGQLARKAVASFFLGENEFALTAFEGSLKLHQKKAWKIKGTYPDFSGAVHVLATLKEKKTGYLDQANTLCYATVEGPYDTIFAYLQGAVLHRLNYLKDAKKQISHRPDSALEWIFYAAAHYWNDEPLSSKDIPRLHRRFKKANDNGYQWMALEFATLIAKFETDENAAKRFEIIAAQMAENLGTSSILSTLQKTEKWQRSLEALLQLKPKKSRKGSKSSKETRLVWVADFQHQQVQPVEQTQTKKGWTKGRNVSLKRLKEGTLKCLTDQDREAIRAIESFGYGYYGSHQELGFNYEKLVKALVGHPLLFLSENRNVSVELVEQKPQLIVEENGEYFEVKFAHPFHETGTAVLKETPTRYIVVSHDEIHRSINHLLDYGKLKVPKEAKGKVIEMIGRLSSVVTVQSEIGGQSVEMKTVEANAVPHLHLLPVGEGFKIEFFVKPFTTDPPYFKPGEGRANVMAEIKGHPVKTQRNLKLEKKNARHVEDACPALLRMDSQNLEWHFENAEDCLNVLMELEPLRTGGEVVLEHPKGEKLRITGHVGFDQLSLGIKKERNWFELDGKVQVNEDLVMDFRELLDLAQKSESNFVEVSDGQFLALTSQLRRRLDDLNSVISKTKNDLRFHPLAAPMIEGFTDLLHDLETDAAWKKQLARLSEAKELKPKVPSTFKAELRNYQHDGFRWLSQLAYWGVGACLADDMGLGKTIQALAVILDRATEGPAMVVAPASVVRNWYHETKRFAPTLRPLIFGKGDRKEMFDDLQPFDLLLCSYGLMQQENKRFLEKHFTTIVLDEAQAIKNRSTKRSQAAMQLQGDFRIITTGTPIENHLGELWSLFNFLNPGLLGTMNRFNEKFAVPIERFQDKDRRNQLKRLIQPFILRRRKSEVLNELPPKTEVTLTVELSKEERAFYEALRRKAVESIEIGGGEPGDKRFKILAELMRLRQACCHPRMVDPNSKLGSSKLNLLAETVEELIAEGHKILVFSQFVKHLKLVREWVEEQNISYQYLDGSTPLGQRDKSIRAFQSGEGDLFLISLKAGGFGLNLTAADYVIHLDPWWNPAVEDQASDRAHRIGQQRPVTIYRLVAENTIEEKIVKLHAEKRDLADSLLEGTERSAKMSAADLLELMKG
ncbi:MAG TPA: DEAD/DEAH box helicase [Bacteroidetes bacterium]|nr:DEAD/DEAH box helicase [Bacteroidota bacterium]